MLLELSIPHLNDPFTIRIPLTKQKYMRDYGIQSLKQTAESSGDSIL